MCARKSSLCTDDRTESDAERLRADAGGTEQKDGAQMLQEEYRALTGVRHDGGCAL